MGQEIQFVGFRVGRGYTAGIKEPKKQNILVSVKVDSECLVIGKF